MGDDEEKMSGIKLLEFITNNTKAIPPSYILGMTAYDEALIESQSEYASVIWQVIKFDFSSSSWKENLINSVRYLVSTDIPPYINDGRTYHTDIGIVCALEEELESVLEQSDSYERFEIKYDQNIYYKLTYNIDERQLTAIAVSCPQMGMSTSGVIAQHIISKFRPRILAMAGICAGIKEKVNYGDVLIAEPCFEWGGGKLIENENNELELKHAPYPWRIDSTVKNILRIIKNDQDFFNEIHKNFLLSSESTPTDIPKLKIGAMASGSSVLQSQKMIDFIKKQHKDLIGIEMESYSVFTASQLADEPKPICVSIKSVCDFGDPSKNDNYHKFAAYTSAATLTRFIKDWFKKN
nr:hypothetical protein [Vibrio fluvialis]